MLFFSSSLGEDDRLNFFDDDSDSSEETRMGSNVPEPNEGRWEMDST